MITLPDGWTSISSRGLADGTVLVLAEHLHPVDLGSNTRNLFDQYTTFRVARDGIVGGQIRWDRASAEANASRAQ